MPRTVLILAIAVLLFPGEFPGAVGAFSLLFNRETHWLGSKGFTDHANATVSSDGCKEEKDRVAPYLMSHTTKQKTKLLGRIRRLKGQMEAVERALEAEAPCGEILNLVASVRGAVNGLMVELIEDHVRQHVVDPDDEPDSDRGQGAAELIDVVRTYLR